eukprot:g8036.t1
MSSPLSLQQPLSLPPEDEKGGEEEEEEVEEKGEGAGTGSASAGASTSRLAVLGRLYMGNITAKYLAIAIQPPDRYSTGRTLIGRKSVRRVVVRLA